MPVIPQLLESFFFSFYKMGAVGWMSSLLIWAENFFPFRLFPLREHGMNLRAKPLTCQEIQVLKAFVLEFCGGRAGVLRSEGCEDFP